MGERERSEQEFREKAQQTYGRKERGRELQNKTRGRVGWEKKERKHERVVKVKVFEKNSVREQGEFGEK